MLITVTITLGTMARLFITSSGRRKTTTTTKILRCEARTNRSNISTGDTSTRTIKTSTRAFVRSRGSLVTMGLGLFRDVPPWGRYNQALTLKCRARPNFWPEDDRDVPRASSHLRNYPPVWQTRWGSLSVATLINRRAAVLFSLPVHDSGVRCGG